MLEELVNKLENDVSCELSKEEIKLLYGIDCKFDNRFKYCLSYRNNYEDLVQIFDEKLIAKTQNDINENTVVCLSNLCIDEVLPTYNLKYIFGNLTYCMSNFRNLENLEVIYGNLELKELNNFDGLDNLRDILDFIEFYALKSDLDLSDIDFEANIELWKFSGDYEVTFPNKVKSICFYQLSNPNKCKLPDDLEYLKIVDVDSLKNLEFPKNLKYLYLRLDDMYNKKQRIADILNTFGEYMGITADEIDFGIDNKNLIDDLKFNDNLKSLELYIENYTGINLPKNLEILNLPITSRIDNIVLPDTLKELSVSKLKNIDNLVLPDGLERLLIHNVNTLENLKLPSALKILDVASISILKNIELKDDIKIYVLGNLVTKEDIKQKYLI